MRGVRGEGTGGGALAQQRDSARPTHRVAQDDQLGGARQQLLDHRLHLAVHCVLRGNLGAATGLAIQGCWVVSAACAVEPACWRIKQRLCRQAGSSQLQPPPPPDPGPPNQTKPQRPAHHQDGQVLVDQRQRPVLHLAGIDALRVDQSHLLHLERRLERGRVVVAPPEEDEVLRVPQLDRKPLHHAVELQGLAGRAGEGGEGADDGEALGGLGAGVGAEEEGDHCEGNDLGGVGLGVVCVCVGQVFVVVLMGGPRRRLGGRGLGCVHGAPPRC
jgi:hypothetical protein